MEAGIKSVVSHVRALKLALEGRYKIRLHQSEHAMAWLVDHAANLLSRFGPGTDGKSPFTMLKGRPSTQPIAEFGECIMYRPHKSAKIAGKLDARLLEGVYFLMQVISLQPASKGRRT